MGEQWSPQTEPARQADIPIIPSVLPAGNMLSTIGIRIPNVPHEVPVAKEIPQATRKMIAGRKLLSAPAEARAFSTNASDSKSPVIFLREVAIVRISGSKSHDILKAITKSDSDFLPRYRYLKDIYLRLL